MFRRYFPCGAWAVWLLLASATRGAEPALPPTATGSDIVWLTSLDLTTLKAEDVRATTHAILGEQASALHGLVEVMDDKLRGLADQGAKQILVARGYGATDDDVPFHEHTILRFAPGVDQKKLGEQIIKSMYGDDFAELFAPRWDGDWLTISGGDEQPTVDEKPTARSAHFAAGYQTLAGRPGMVFVPNARARELDQKDWADSNVKDLPASFVAVNEALHGCNWAAMAVALGKKPEILFAIELADAGQAQVRRRFSAIAKGLAPAGDRACALHRPVGSHGQAAPVSKANRVSLTVDAKAARPWVEAVVLEPLRQSRQVAADAQAMAQVEQLAQAVMQYEEKKGELPASLDELKAFLLETEAMDEDDWTLAITNVKTGENPGFVYTRPARRSSDMKGGAGKTVIVEELKDGKPDPDGYRGYLDGTVDSKANPKK